jgi:hypothetical protein
MYYHLPKCLFGLEHWLVGAVLLFTLSKRVLRVVETFLN